MQKVAGYSILLMLLTLSGCSRSSSNSIDPSTIKNISDAERYVASKGVKLTKTKEYVLPIKGTEEEVETHEYSVGETVVMLRLFDSPKKAERMTEIVKSGFEASKITPPPLFSHGRVGFTIIGDDSERLGELLQ